MATNTFYALDLSFWGDNFRRDGMACWHLHAKRCWGATTMEEAATNFALSCGRKAGGTVEVLVSSQFGGPATQFTVECITRVLASSAKELPRLTSEDMEEQT